MCRHTFLVLALFLAVVAPRVYGQPTCTLTVSPTSGTVPLTVTASGFCSSPDQNITDIFLAWGDGAGTFVPQGFTVSHTYNSSATVQVVVTAYDDTGASGSASQTVTISPPPPPLKCSPSATPASGEVPLAVTVAANCSSSNKISNVTVKLGDGFYQAGESVTHTYVAGGKFTVVVTATDSAGNAALATTDVNVTPDTSLLVGVNNGQVKKFSKSGSVLATLNTQLAGSTTGMGFDELANLYVTNFTSNAVSKFTGTRLAGKFGGGYNCKPESIVFDKASNGYVGETGCSRAILKFDPYGTLTAVFQPAVEQQGTDWIDLAPDQCTIYYTSQGSSVLRFNACTGQQLPPFTKGLKEALALRILPDSGAVVADLQNIVRFDASGNQVMTYDAAGDDCWSALTLDSDGTSFWATDYCTSDVVHFDLNSGAQVSKFNAGTPPNTVFGIATAAPGAPPTPAGTFVASPASATVSRGQAASYSLAFTPVGAADGQNFSFWCANLPVGASCTFSPPGVTAHSGGVTATLAINTGTGTLAASGRSSRVPYAVFLPVLGLAVFPLFPKRRGKALWCVLVAIAVTAMMLSCGGGGATSSSQATPNAAAPTPNNGETPSGAYTVIVHAQSGSLESSTTVQLKVQ